MVVNKDIFEIDNEVEEPPKTKPKPRKNIKRPNKMTEDEIQLLSLISQKLNPEKPKQTRTFKPEVKEKMMGILRENMKKSIVTRQKKKIEKKEPLKTDIKVEKPDEKADDKAEKTEKLTKLLTKLLESKSDIKPDVKPEAKISVKPIVETFNPWWRD
jgi:hypothetical protein